MRRTVKFRPVADRAVTVLLVLALVLSACSGPRGSRPDSGITRGVSVEHLPADLSAVGITLPAQLAWLDEGSLVYASRSGIEVLTAKGGRPTTLAGKYWRVSPAPGGQRIAYWGDAGLGLAVREPLQAGLMLWDAAGMAAWARGQVGADSARWWVEEIRWSPNGRQVAALVRAEGPERRTASALVVFDADRGDRLMLWGRTGQEGSIRAFNWAKMLLVQYNNFPDGASLRGKDHTSTLLLLAEPRDPKVAKSMATLPYPLTLSDVQGSTALFLPTLKDYAESFPMRPQIGSVAVVGVTPTPVGEEGQSGLLSPRDGQFVALRPDQAGAAIAPDGSLLAVLVPASGQQGLYTIRLDEVPAPASGVIDLDRARPVTVQLTPAPSGDGPPPTLVDVAFRTEQEGFGATHEGSIYRTANGGVSWTQIYRTDGVELERIFLAGSAVFALGRRSDDSRHPILLSSPDGGSTWSITDPAGLSEDAVRAWTFLNYAFITSQIGFAVPDPDSWGGSQGTTTAALLATTDGGRTWKARPLPDGLRTSGGISFVTPERGFITAFAKEGSQILSTADGGRTWKAVYTSKVPLYSLQFLDVRQGFAGGGNSPKYGFEPLQYLLRTRDGGVTWEESYRSDGRTGSPLAALRFSSAREGWAALGVCTSGQNRPCGRGLVYTRDGGRTWEGQGYGGSGFSTAGASAWGVTGDSGQAVLSHTADGGTTWRSLWSPAAVAVRQAHLTGDSGGWIQTNVGLFRTRAGGQTWQPANFGLQTSAPIWPIFARGGIIYLQKEQRLLRSADEGKTWQDFALPEVQESVNHLTFAGPSDGWVVYTGKLYATHDGGRTWERFSPGLTDYVSAMAFGDASHGVAAGPRSVLLTSDGGKTWSGQPLKNVSLTSASYTPDGQIWLAGATMTGGKEDGVLLHSPDGGRNWTTYRSPSVYPNWISFDGPSNGWLVAYAGGHQALLVTRDGGATWQQAWPVLK